MNSSQKEKFFQFPKRKLFIQVDECKMNNDNDINDIKNIKTYNDYYFRLNLRTNNFKDENNIEIENEYNETEQNNIPLKNRKNNTLSKQSSSKNNNEKDILTKMENNSDIKKSFENDNKTEKEEDLIPNISSIENKNSDIKNDSANKQNTLENNDNKENINNENKTIKRKMTVYEPNILRATKIQVLKQKINNRNSKNKEKNNIEKNREVKQQNSSLIQRTFKREDKNISNINYKINHYLTNLEEGKNNNSSNYNNLRLNILRRKIRKKNKFEILNDQEKTSRLTYQGLNRYQNFSISNISQIPKRIDTYFMINRIKNNEDNLKREIGSISNNDNTNRSNKFYEILKKNKGINDLFKNMIIPNINDRKKKNYNTILSQLSKTIEKLPKNEANFQIDKIDFNNTFRKYYYSKKNEISPIDKNIKDNILFFEKKNLTRANDITDKNKKLIFESKMNDINNTINKLLKVTPEYNVEKRVTFPANNFRQTKSISKNYNKRKNIKLF